MKNCLILTIIAIFFTKIGLEAQTIKVGNQIWMSENLNLDKFKNGDQIPEVKTAEEWQLAARNKQPAWCYYNNDPIIGKKNGIIYNWYAVNDPRGLAPDGWRLPSSDDFDVLILSYGGKNLAGKKIKQLDENGFKGFAAGERNQRGVFHSMNETSSWWCSDWNTEYFAFYIYLDFKDESLFKYGFLQNKSCGLYVRCLKD
jgi:uncharacterized protein (TIGR02145 family)